MRSAIIGCGRIAPIHARAMMQTEGLALTACADINPEKAAAFAEEFGLEAFTDYRELLAVAKPEAVHICTPHHLHVQMAEEALNRGIHVILEKPAAISKDSFYHLVQVQEHSGAQIGICFQNRYNAAITHLKDRLDNGEGGAVLGARCFLTWKRGQDYYSDGWHGRRETEGGGVLINQAIHYMDLLVHLLGPATDVQAAMHNRHLQGVIDVEDTLEAYIRFQDAPVLFYASLAYSADAPILMEIDCEHATYSLSGEELTITTRDDQRSMADHSRLPDGGLPYWGSSHKLLIADFYQSIQKKQPFPITPSSVQDTMALVYGCYASAHTGKTVVLENRKDTA